MNEDSIFFQISSPRDMLEKAKREYSRMKLNLDTDVIFNFFVTTHHIMDYIKTLRTIDSAAINKILNDEDYKMCKYICNKGKHAILRTRSQYNSHSDGPPGGIIIHSVKTTDGAVRVDELADRLIAKWEKFFADNHI